MPLYLVTNAHGDKIYVGAVSEDSVRELFKNQEIKKIKVLVP